MPDHPHEFDGCGERLAMLFVEPESLAGRALIARFGQAPVNVIDDEHVLHDDATVVLPWAGSYRGFDWNHRRAVLDPAPRFLPGTVLVDDSVRLVDRVVPPEDPRVEAVAAGAHRAARARFGLDITPLVPGLLAEVDELRMGAPARRPAASTSFTSRARSWPATRALALPQAAGARVATPGTTSLPAS